MSSSLDQPTSAMTSLSGRPDESRPLVSTIVPAMNEEGNIDEFVRLFAEMRETAPFDCELVYIDDGSTDTTRSKMLAAASRHDWIRVAWHQRNRGLTEALQTGFAAATGSIFVFYPADLQFLPEDIPRLVAPITERGIDLVAGWKQGKYQKAFVSSIYNAFSRWLFNLEVHDMNAVKAFRREVVERIFLRKDWHRYLVVLAANEGFTIDEVKVPLYERAWGSSKFTGVWRILIGVLDLLAVKFQISFLKKPLLYFGTIGVGLFGLAGLIGLFAVYRRYVEGVGDRNLVFLVIFLAGLGMGFFMLGFMSEGQTALKEEITDLRRRVKRLGSSDDTNESPS